ncbi:hypothetical protein ANCDUO_07283 [Ancylostoma duodenale]|uniref:Uncharacterized protein n=1 Tax=Ancylostoma duodenale TaxID=51022 RepID=A0A0C2GTX5_9BILA|nr:hypothetical protein ANCDUO_07283 [Ancylostoma duodenale]
MRSGFSILTFTGVPSELTKVLMQNTSLNPTYTPKRLCFASGGAYTASNTRELLTEGFTVTADVHIEQESEGKSQK